MVLLCWIWGHDRRNRMDLHGTFAQLWLALPTYAVCLCATIISPLATYTHQQFYLRHLLYVLMLSFDCRNESIADVIYGHNHGTDGILLHGKDKKLFSTYSAKRLTLLLHNITTELFFPTVVQFYHIVAITSYRSPVFGMFYQI